MSNLHICMFSILLLQNFVWVNCLQCRYCSSVDRDSPCRLGNETKTKKCDPAKGDDACYEEYLLGKKDSDVPLYRRGCAPKNWCDTQEDTQGTDLKDCNTCQSDKCNKDIFGTTSNRRVCRTCSSESIDSQCRKGGNDLKKMTCKENQECYMSYVSTSRRNIYKRGCASDDICDKMGNEYKDSLQQCYVCEDDLCNNLRMKIAV